MPFDVPQIVNIDELSREIESGLRERLGNEYYAELAKIIEVAPERETMETLRKVIAEQDLGGKPKTPQYWAEKTALRNFEDAVIERDGDYLREIQQQRDEVEKVSQLNVVR